jgi:hypothetical protein
VSRPTREQIDRYIAANPDYHVARPKRLAADLRAIDYDTLSEDEQRREVNRLTRESGRGDNGREPAAGLVGASSDIAETNPPGHNSRGGWG